MKPRLVLSGVNFVEAGPLSIFQDALDILAEHFLDRYEVVALVHRKNLFHTPGIAYLEFPGIKSSWLRRMRFEYWDCRALSRTLRPRLWLSMHDITPNVEASVRAVYCHNPAPFYRPGLREALMDWKLALFSAFYRYLYAINIGKNQFVIVQQQWMREEFRRRYAARDIIVAHPSIPSVPMPVVKGLPPDAPTVFLFPAYPRTFKNVELLLYAAELLEQQGAVNFEVWLTIKGDENRYAASLYRSFGHVAPVRWLGLQPRSTVEEFYARANCLIFPSRLESWGMPISEFKQTGKPMIVADLPYAHETVGDYKKMQFVSATDPQALATAMHDVMRGSFVPHPEHAAPIAAPFAEDWRQLFTLLLEHEAGE